jgi:16S rRNA (guanine527-N7)-methyltransferase
MTPREMPEEERPSGASPGVLDALAQARAFGYLGPGPLQTHLDHSHGFGDVVETVSSVVKELTDGGFRGRVVDLGTGGGIPGLVLADRWPESRWLFVDSHQRRMGTLRDVLHGLGWADRTEVVLERAELVARRPDLRGQCDLVVARGFAAPAVTVECATGFLRPGGLLVVSEPPEGPDRWSDRVLAQLGMARVVHTPEAFRFFVAVQERPCPPKYPRAVGVPAKSPLF